MEKYNQKTNLIHTGIKRSQYGELSEAIFLTQGFVYDSANQAEMRFLSEGPDEYIYTRYGNPTIRMFEERMSMLEGAEDAFATASGMAAISNTLFSLLRAGDHIVSSRVLFGSCLYIVSEILPRWGVEVTLVDGTDLDQWQKAVRPNTKVCFLESISNPMLEVIDIRGVSDIAHSVGALVFVDNVFATPVFQHNLSLGADIVAYSATKHIDGQGRCMGGIVLGSQYFIKEIFKPFSKHTGPAISPFNAWIMQKGLETIHLRCNAQADTAQKLVDVMRDHRALERVIYPTDKSHPQCELAYSQMTKGGTVVSFIVKGGKEAAFRVLNSFDIITISNNLGDAKTLATHPVTTTHKNLSQDAREKAGICDGLIRLSVGLEDVDDLTHEILKALDQA